ncbi:hypothetical protein KM043_014151 [Ampulex compressa]|nr:hypothetical protein KM043_014151 [Ampulex compressa]
MKLTGFAKSYEKFSIINELLKSTTAEKPPTFPSLLRNSALMDLGDPEGKYVHGNIVDIVGDDLYIDFGWKFNCVCPRPKVDPTLYVRGAKVLLLVKSLELSSKFLGAKKDLTILEADCILVSLLSSPLFHFEKKL